jgi:hypothetical protein
LSRGAIIVIPQVSELHRRYEIRRVQPIQFFRPTAMDPGSFEHTLRLIAEDPYAQCLVAVWHWPIRNNAGGDAPAHRHVAATHL